MKPNPRFTRCLLASAVLVAVGTVSLPDAVADSESAARKHAGKANHLASKNKCKAALPEFNRAYKTLKDPTLLFNRAECYRKLGKNEEARKDYEQFIADMPETPNRATVEARIASMREESQGGGAPSTAVAKETPAANVKDVAAPVAKPAEKAPVVPAAPAAKPADKAPAVTSPTAPAVKSTDKAPTVPAAPSAEKAPAAPIRRAEKWTD